MSISKDEFIERVTKFQRDHAKALLENNELKLRSQYELLKSTGLSGDELMMQMIQYSSFLSINVASTLMLSVIWDYDLTEDFEERQIDGGSFSD